eukprot:365362-Chlamydomonas_euryale.AAC.19
MHGALACTVCLVWTRGAVRLVARFAQSMVHLIVRPVRACTQVQHFCADCVPRCAGPPILSVLLLAALPPLFSKELHVDQVLAGRCNHFVGATAIRVYSAAETATSCLEGTGGRPIDLQP